MAHTPTVSDPPPAKRATGRRVISAATACAVRRSFIPVKIRQNLDGPARRRRAPRCRRARRPRHATPSAADRPRAQQYPNRTARGRRCGPRRDDRAALEAHELGAALALGEPAERLADHVRHAGDRKPLVFRRIDHDGIAIARLRIFHAFAMHVLPDRLVAVGVAPPFDIVVAAEICCSRKSRTFSAPRCRHRLLHASRHPLPLALPNPAPRWSSGRRSFAYCKAAPSGKYPKPAGGHSLLWSKFIVPSI